MRRFVACVVVSVLTLATTACGGESPDVAVPTPEELVAALMTVEDVGTEWGEFRLQEESGLVTDDNRDYLPELELCPEAGEDAVVAEDLDWQAVAAVFNVERSDAHPAVAFHELLLAGEPEDIEDLYERLVVAMRACEGVSWETDPSQEEGALPVTTEAMAAPGVGDDSYGSRSLVVERDYVWDARTVVARDGAVLVSLTYLDVHDADGEALIGQEDMDAIFTTVVDKLP